VEEPTDSGLNKLNEDQETDTGLNIPEEKAQETIVKVTIQEIVTQKWAQYDPESTGSIDKIEAHNFVNEVMLQKGKNKLSNLIQFN